jgi:hypothetical protein
MSAPAYSKDAADNHDWWFFSCTALGAMSPGEPFKMLHEQLSEAGANAVIAVRFLDESDRALTCNSGGGPSSSGTWAYRSR